MNDPLMSEYKIVSINIGKPTTMMYRGKELSTGINKQPADKPLFLSFTNLEGDGQADLVHHGGRDKAVCVYSYDHYPFWEKQLNKHLQAGAFGENLTVSGIKEEDVCIGDIFQIGEAVVQVSQPRYPCHKLSKKHDVPDLPQQVIQTGFSGFYLRVLEEGVVPNKATMFLLEQHQERISISFVNRIKNEDKENREALIKLVGLDVLAEDWKSSLVKRL